MTRLFSLTYYRWPNSRLCLKNNSKWANWQISLLKRYIQENKKEQKQSPKQAGKTGQSVDTLSQVSSKNGSNPATTCLCKPSFITTQPWPFLHILCMITFTLQFQRWAVRTKTSWPPKYEHLQLSFYKKFPHICYNIWKTLYFFIVELLYSS